MRKVIIIVLALIFITSGCSVVLQKRHTSDMEEIEKLSYQVDSLNRQLADLSTDKDAQIRDLRQAKDMLERSLKKEIGDEAIALKMGRGGLTITILDQVLFDSGKAKLRPRARQVLNKVARVFKSKLRERYIDIQGHTDNQPIKYSGWKSNWELSTARATSVLHYLVADGLSPQKLSASGYGEYRPVASNDTKEGRQKNRRVEIIVLPEELHQAEKLPFGSERPKYQK